VIEQEVIEKLKKRYSSLHPLIFQRSVERAKDAGQLFDILDSIPEGFPLVWDEDVKRWQVTRDLSQASRFNNEESDWSTK